MTPPRADALLKLLRLGPMDRDHINQVMGGDREQIEVAFRYLQEQRIITYLLKGRQLWMLAKKHEHNTEQRASAQPGQSIYRGRKIEKAHGSGCESHPWRATGLRPPDVSGNC